MPVAIPGRLVDFLLLGPFDDRRQLQDSPILGDVWADFGARPDKPLELLIAPYHGESVGSVAQRINNLLPPDVQLSARVSCVHGIVAAQLKFSELLRYVVPLTYWWDRQFGGDQTVAEQPALSTRVVAAKNKAKPKRPPNYDLKDLELIFADALEWSRNPDKVRMREIPAIRRFAALAGLILWAADQEDSEQHGVEARIKELLAVPDLARQIDTALDDVVNDIRKGKPLAPCVYSISRNRRAMPALEKSVRAVKADAAKQLFSVDCHDIGWAVLDSGIDFEHPAFADVHGKSRIRQSFDFTSFRDYVSLANLHEGHCKKRAKELMNDNWLKDESLKEGDVQELLRVLAESAQGGEGLRWDLVQKLVEIKPEKPVTLSHGTHVAGIIGANKERVETKTRSKQTAPVGLLNGMCPDINLYDFRVLAADLDNTEFAIIAALQFIRYLNQRDAIMSIHGANLSLSIPHNVRNYACGQTPICEECNRLSENGVVVVAAAGNHGYKTFTTNEGEFDGYAAFSITDPGNADDVITVGSTHRFWPHTYGVSFFSSRGPTGDGRLKPDLVAPGEKIRAPFVDGQWGELDGTSMAAPHVSGAAAMLMARYSEFRGRPRKIKEILCDTATDLGRERSFQGHGMLDVLRAFQSI